MCVLHTQPAGGAAGLSEYYTFTWLFLTAKLYMAPLTESHIPPHSMNEETLHNSKSQQTVLRAFGAPLVFKGSRAIELCVDRRKTRL